MHGIYKYVPEINHVFWVQDVAAILYLQFVLHVMVFRPCNIAFIIFIVVVVVVFVVVLSPA